VRALSNPHVTMLGLHGPSLCGSRLQWDLRRALQAAGQHGKLIDITPTRSSGHRLVPLNGAGAGRQLVINPTHTASAT